MFFNQYVQLHIVQGNYWTTHASSSFNNTLFSLFIEQQVKGTIIVY